MQSRSFELWIFGFADNADAWPGLPHDLLHLVIVVYPLHCQSQYNAKNLSFSAIEAAVHM